MSDKYIVFKREDFERLMEEIPEANWWDCILEDAVVIRRQDAFAPPALDAYANAIQLVIEMQRLPSDDSIEQLQEIADYFHGQADMAWNEKRKLPD